MPLNREGIFKTGIDRKGPQYLDATDIIGLWFEIKKGTPGSGSTTGGAEGAVQFSAGLDIFGGDVDRFFWDNTNKRLGIGTNDPDFDLQLNTVSTSYPRGFAIYQYSADFRPPIFIGRKHRGTPASPSPVLEDDILVELAADAWHSGGGYGYGGAFLLAADEDWTSTAWGNRAEFWTTGLGSTSPQRRWLIEADGAFLPSDDDALDIGTLNYKGNELRPRSLYLSQFIELDEIADPAAPADGRVRIYARDAGGGKTELVALFPSGVAQQITVEL